MHGLQHGIICFAPFNNIKNSKMSVVSPTTPPMTRARAAHEMWMKHCCFQHFALSRTSILNTTEAQMYSMLNAPQCIQTVNVLNAEYFLFAVFLSQYLNANCIVCGMEHKTYQLYLLSRRLLYIAVQAVHTHPTPLVWHPIDVWRFARSMSTHLIGVRAQWGRSVCLVSTLVLTLMWHGSLRDKSSGALVWCLWGY